MKPAIIFYLQLNGYAKRRQLLAYLKLQGIKASDRKVRLAIESLIEDDGYCIQSSDKGYKLVTTPAEYQQARDYISSYIFSMLKKRRSLERNFLRLTSKLIPA